MPRAEIMSAMLKPSSRERIARRPSLHTGLPSSWNNSLRQCAGAILLFALATVVTQQAALGVVLLGLVRSFALLVFVAGGVMYPYSRIRAAQQARGDASQDPDAKAKASGAPASLNSFPQSFPQSGSSGATRGDVRRSQAPPPSGSGADATSVAAEAAAAPFSPPRVDGPSRPTGSARRLTVKSKPFWESREQSNPPRSGEADAKLKVKAEVEPWPTHRSRLARAADADAARFPAAPPTEEEVEREAQEGCAERASAMLAQLMAQGQRPSARVCHAVVRAYAAAGRPAQASAWLERMLAAGLRPEAHAFNAAMGAHFGAADSDGGEGARALLARMVQLQWPSLRWVQGHWASRLEDIDCC
eukprot:CAMPEP_0118824186 /NCGR_PEP_ID=MMETSP1162-20130426/10416_1 /TAXON_ID=33656 /ORGANISM="Phaeocystis Sp, Strain CCMP2710" /LENGTH=359 /DNA_ID=CAMNT_0006754815 /DNA_START=27 /DNA_END=1106 /DNA_ORIENTATION=+